MATVNLTSTPSYASSSSADETNWRENMWYIMFLVIAISGIIGNVAITWIVWAHRSMKTITNVFIGNIGIAGLLLALSIFPIIFPFRDYPSFWHLPGFCVTHAFVTSVGFSVFVFSLMLMSIERYYAIKCPDEDMPSVRSGVTFKIWFCSFILSVPSWLFIRFEQIGKSAGTCFIGWPDVLGGETAGHVYSLLLILTTYFIPVGIMLYRSAQLGAQLWSHKSVDLTKANKDVQKQTITMTIVQVIVFAILWFPIRVYSFLFENYSPAITIIFLWMAMTSIVFYPMIYICMENRFQKKLKKVVRWCPCVDYEMKSENYVLGKAEQSTFIEGNYRPISDV